MRLTLIHPAIGRRDGQNYIRGWQMEPLPPALIAGLTPKDVEIRFYDDRMEAIPYDEPTDLVALSIETYTARRAYQIASEYRERGVPVVMGGFHATLCPEEVEQYAEAIVIGEAEQSWARVIDDARHQSLQRRYQGEAQTSLTGLHYDRGIFRGKRYLPLSLVEAGRGCRYRCEFCAIQSFFDASHKLRPVDDLIKELRRLKHSTRLFFFVDDNFAADREGAKELLRAMIPLNIRWVTQLAIDAAHDGEFLELLVRSGCRGVLIGFESLDPDNLRQMHKGFNRMRGGYANAMANLRRHRLRVYATFVFGYDQDKIESFDETLDFALAQRFYIAAFNHLTPFPGTPLYKRLLEEGRMLFPNWWMDERYSYNQIPFQPRNIQPMELQEQCVAARQRFYSLRNILRRGFDSVNRADAFMFRNFFPINLMHRSEVSVRNHYPLGDETWRGALLKVQ